MSKDQQIAKMAKEIRELKAQLNKQATLEPIFVDDSNSDYQVRGNKARVVLDLDFWSELPGEMGRGMLGIEEEFGMTQEEAFEKFKKGLRQWVDKNWYLGSLY